MIRLGFSIRILGASNLPSHDARSWDDGAHLSMSLAYLRDVLLYLQANDIQLYRMHSRLLASTLVEDPALRQTQIRECRALIDALQVRIAESGVRLTLHPYSAVVLNAPDEERIAQSLVRLGAYTELLDMLGLGPEGVVVLHVGGVYHDIIASTERFLRRYDALPERVQRRVVIENDDHRYSWVAVQAIHQRCGVPLVFDALHHLVHNPKGIKMQTALQEAIASWPAGVRPKLHYASPRTELRRIQGSGRIKTPTWTEHADYVNPFEFIRWLRDYAAVCDTDIMLEAKARDLALIQLRKDLVRFAPDISEWVR